MLAKVFRLTSQKDFSLVKEKGRITHSSNFSLSVYPRNDSEPSRFGFIIPNKVVPLAHDRNRIKRVLSEGTRFQLTFVAPGFDCVFLPKASILRAYTADVMKEVGEAFRNASIIK